MMRETSIGKVRAQSMDRFLPWVTASAVQEGGARGKQSGIEGHCDNLGKFGG
jgi:hypothetical protein